MFTRRTTLGHISCAAAATLVPRVANASTRYRGCVRSAARGQTAAPNTLETSGEKVIDEVCLGEVEKLNAAFGLKVSFAFYHDGDTGNALAYFGAGAQPRTDGTVYFGRKLAREAFRPENPIPGLPIVAIMAHEWSHVLQYKVGTRSGWGVHYELSADFVAGRYLGSLPNLDIASVQGVVTTFTDVLADTDFMDKDHHGSPAQRSKIMLMGFHGSPSLTEVPTEARPMTPQEAGEALESGLHYTR